MPAIAAGLEGDAAEARAGACAKRCCLVLAALLSSSCGARLMNLPSGPRVPAADAPAAQIEATAACRNVTSLAAVASVRGSVGGQRIRGNLETGLSAPASARIEAIAPFGQPLFIFVARGDDASLWLPRDRRLLEHGRPDQVLEAITGVPLDVTDLRAALTGCSGVSSSGEAIGDEWRVVRDAGGGEVYLRREGSTWRLVATVRRDPGRPAWRAEYREFVEGLPRTIRLTSLDEGRFDLRLSLSQVDVNTPLDAAAFELRVTGDADPITLDELRRSGPLADVEPPSSR
jgi:hypothetical protein